MTAPTQKAASRSAGKTHQVEQIYVTHCVQSDSVLGNAGYSVRASSTEDRELLDFAQQFANYALPLHLQSKSPGPGEAPRRLGWFKAPGKNRMALVHTAHLKEDTTGRPNSFFIHVLICPPMPLNEVLSTWGTPNWVTEYERGNTKQLRPLKLATYQGTINDEVLTAFLAEDPGQLANGDLATRLLPPDLRDKPQQRRDLLRLALLGCELSLQEGGDSPQRPFYILGEPGLVALLLYGAARLLPKARRDRILTFSTFENMHRALPSFQLGYVAGTMPSQPGKALDSDYYTGRGYALDTWTGKHSPELSNNAYPEVENLVELAREGLWEVVDLTYSFLGDEKEKWFGEALAAAELDYKLKHHGATLEDLDLPQKNRWRQQVLDDNEEGIWDTVHIACLQDANKDEVRQKFRATLQQQRADLERAAHEALQNGNKEWQDHWDLLKFVVKKKAEQRELFLQPIPSQSDGRGQQSGPLYLRAFLLREWQALQNGPHDFPPQIEYLLSLIQPQDLERIGAKLRWEWLAQALFHLLKQQKVDDALGLLTSGESELAHHFWEHMRDQGRRGKLIWELLCNRINVGELLWRSEQQHFHNFLVAGREQVGGATPKPAATLIDGWTLLRQHFREPFPGSEARWLDFLFPSRSKQLIEVCTRSGSNPLEVVGSYFAVLNKQGKISAQLLDRLIAILEGFYPPAHRYKQFRQMVQKWLAITRECGDSELRLKCQWHYIRTRVPRQFYPRLAQEPLLQQHPSLVTQLNAVPQPLETLGTAHAPPAMEVPPPNSPYPALASHSLPAETLGDSKLSSGLLAGCLVGFIVLIMAGIILFVVFEP